MAADQTLVQGAREASAYYGGVVDEARKELFDNLNEQVANAAAKKQAAVAEQQAEEEKLQKQAESEAEALEQQALAEKKALEEQWEKETTSEANDILVADGSLSGENYGAVHDNVNGKLKDDYVNGTPKERALAMNELQKRTQEVNSMKDYSQENAALWVNANQAGKPFNPDGYSLALQDEAYANEKKMLGGHCSKNSFNIKDDVNEAGDVVGSRYGLRGSYNEETGEYEFMGVDEAITMSDKFRFDQSSQAELLALQNTMVDIADQGDHNSTFDMASAKNKVKSILNASDKKLSLMYDEMIEGRSFKNDLMGSGMLSGVTYEQLGLSPEQAYEMERAAGEENPDGVIGSDALTAEDQKLILSKFMTSDDMKGERDEMLTTYYTDIMHQGWQKKNNEIKEQYYKNNPAAVVVESGNTNVDNTSTDSDANTDSSGDVNVDDDGVFVPESNVESTPTGTNQRPGEIAGFRSRIKRDYMDESKVSDEDIQAYFNSMEGKLNTEIFNTANFQQWLRSNNKEIPLRY
jgi:hypothetical protein